MNDRELSFDNTQLRELRIFASGFSRHTTTAQVAEYFSIYGGSRVEKYDSYFKRHQSETKYKGGEGYFILFDLHLATYKRILEACPHRIQSRCLEVCPLKTGLDLILYNSQKNQRRVLIKKVPAVVSEQVLLDSIRVQFGPVEKFFGYKSEGKSRGASNLDSSKRYVTYSVTFQDKASAARSARQGYIIIQTECEQRAANVEKFKRTKLGHKDMAKSAINPKVSAIENFKFRFSKQAQAEEKSSRRIVQEPESTVLARKSRFRNPSDENRQPAVTVFSSALEDSLWAEQVASLADRDSSEALLQKSAGTEHQIKPTSKVYRLQFSLPESAGNLVFRCVLGSNNSSSQIEARSKVQPPSKVQPKSLVGTFPRFLVSAADLITNKSGAGSSN